MKILFVSPGFGGSGVDYLSTLADELQKRGHQVDGLCFAAYPSMENINMTSKWTLRSFDRYIWENITKSYPWITGYIRWVFNVILYYRWKRVVAHELNITDYDIVITTRITIAPTVIAASEQGIPSVIITTGPATVKYDPNNTDTDKTPEFDSLPVEKRIQFPFIKIAHRWNNQAFTIATEIIATNEFDASITRDTFGREPKIIYIPVPIDKFNQETKTSSSITLVNPRDSNKGLDIFLKIAEQLPEQEFIIAGSVYDDSLKPTIQRADNITYLGWCDDMRPVYAETKLLLVPSTYQEGGPRVIIEAFASGTPVIGSNIGGIPDYIGDGGDVVNNYTDPQLWVEIINKYLSDDEYYEQKSQIARQRSKLFDQEVIVNEFEKTLNHIVSRT